jgi:hypothetical protein
MKKILLFVLLSGLFCASANAQDTLYTVKKSQAPDVSESVKVMNQGAKSCLTMLLRSTNEKVVNQVWKDFMKEYGGKVSKVKKSEDYLTEGVQIAAISGTGTTNVYHQVEEMGGDVSFTVWFDMGNGNYLDSKTYPNSVKEAVVMLKNFGLDVRRAMVRGELEVAEKDLRKMESEFDKLVKEKSNLERDIENYKKKIQEAEKHILENTATQDMTRQKIEQQKGAVGEITKRLNEIQ